MRKNQVNKSLLSILFGTGIALAAAVCAYFLHISLYYFAAAFGLSILYFARRIVDPFLLILFTALLAICTSEIAYFTPILFSLLMLLIPIYVLMRTGKSLTDVLRELGFHGSPIRAFLFAVFSMIPVFLLMLLLSYAASMLGFNDAQKVDEKISLLPLYVLVYAVTLGPIAEEIFFRSFLTRYMNPIFANLLFAFAHFSYGSVYEILGAFGLGIFLYLIYRLSGDLKTAVFAHMFINLGSLIVMYTALRGLL